MSISEANAKKHLGELSEKDRTSILTKIGNRAVLYQFTIKNGFIYFLKDDQLVCVNLHEENGMYHLWFNGRFIQINCQTGECFIVDFDKNCLEYFCVDDFFHTATMNKSHHSFLYQLLMKVEINRINARIIRSLRIFFTMRELFGKIGKVGKISLIPPSGCLSIHEIVRDIKQSLVDRFSSYFFRMSPPSSIFQKALLLKKKALLLKKNVLPQRPSEANKFYGMGLFRKSTMNKQPSIGMIIKIMMRFVGKSFIVDLRNSTTADSFMRYMFGILSSKMSQKFIENPNGFKEASTEMNELIKSSWKKTDLKAQVDSIGVCVSDMVSTEQARLALLNEQRKKICAEESCKATEAYLQQRRKEMIKGVQAVRKAIEEIQNDIPKIRKNGDGLESPKRSKYFE
jgi:hypothetical protein